MPNVRVKENEPFEIAMRRFKRSCEKAGILAEVRRREAYEKPTTERKRKAAAAVKRHLKSDFRRIGHVTRRARHAEALAKASRINPAVVLIAVISFAVWYLAGPEPRVTRNEAPSGTSSKQNHTTASLASGT